jgi:hypothetical protein
MVRSPLPTASSSDSVSKSPVPSRNIPSLVTISGLWYDQSNNIANVEANGPGEVTITDVNGKTAARGTATGAAYMDVRFHDGSESNGTVRLRGTVEELLWSNGVRWTRQPLGVHGTWFDQRNALLTVSITGDKVLIVDSAALVVAAGTATGKPMSSMTVTFVNGVEAVASISADGSALNWSYREQWSRVPAAAAESDSRMLFTRLRESEKFWDDPPSARTHAATEADSAASLENYVAAGGAAQQSANGDVSAHARWSLENHVAAGGAAQQSANGGVSGRARWSLENHVAAGGAAQQSANGGVSARARWSPRHAGNDARSQSVDGTASSAD